MEQELIKLKGTADGVRIYLLAGADMNEITASLYEKLRQFRKFFGSGHCNIYFVGRDLTSSDKMRLEAVASAMLPESTVYYGEHKRSSERAIEQTLKLPEDIKSVDAVEREQADEKDEQFEQIREVVTTNFKSSRARFYEGAVRAGKAVESDGHLILVGNVEEGGKITAAGNVIVMGSVRGSVEAGCMGSDSAYIIALDFQPSDVRISKYHRVFNREEFCAEENPLPKKAYLINNQIYIEDFLVKI